MLQGITMWFNTESGFIVTFIVYKQYHTKPAFRRATHHTHRDL